LLSVSLQPILAYLCIANYGSFGCGVTAKQFSSFFQYCI
jgi:hypothetical protein